MTTGNNTQIRRARLNSAQQALLEQRLRGEEVALAATSSIPSRPPAVHVPLSFAQQRLWFLDQLQQQSGAYTISLAARLVGPLQRKLLQESLTILVQRHEILRTVFVEEQGMPIQRILPAAPVEIPLLDLRALPEPERTARVNTELEHAHQYRYQLDQGPLFQVLLLQETSEEHILYLGFHHIISDAWSQDIFLREMSTVYNALITRRPALLPALPIQYADFAFWQRSTQAQTLAAEEEYWSRQLAEIQPLELPTDFPRSAQFNHEGVRQTLLLEPLLSKQLQQLCQRSETTLFMVLLATFQVLLSRYSGQTDICIGTAIANRTYEELEGTLGCFTNTLVLRSDLSGQPPFLTLLEQVKRTALEAYAHQHVSFERLVEILQPERDLTRSPLFQVMLIVQNAPASPVHLQDLRLQTLEFQKIRAKFDLTFSVMDTPAGLRCEIEYDATLFSAQSIQRLCQHWRQIVQAVVERPTQRIRDITLLSPEEWQQQIVTWNQTDALFPQDDSIHELFFQQAQQRPDAIALSMDDETLSYATLQEKTLKLASYLRGQGVRPGRLVGLCMRRSPELLIALLAILSAGGTYIPLDPSYPEDRLHFMLEDSQASLLLTDSPAARSFEHFTGTVIALPLTPAQQEVDQQLNTHYSPELPAYVIYTSGSTGRPKGTLITHRSVINFMTSMQRQPGMTDQDAILALTSLSFDIAVLELLLPLITGACIELVSHEVATDGEQLLTRLQQSRATILQATPATWRLLFAASWQGRQELKALSGGEALPLELAHRLSQHSAELWNMYGPTETTIWSTTEQISTGGETPQVITIGRPIANTQIYILDQGMQPLPVGAIGEIYIGGEGLAQGYLGHPALTAERFVPDPFHPSQGQRLYRTGDVGRYHIDGRIECLGRSDHQVKLRGFRIELGEIERSLERHPAIRQAVALIQKSTAQESALVAYLQADQERRLSLQEIRTFLSSSLPAYMIPAHFLWLETFPLTPNGKINRRALPLPEEIEHDQQNQIAPETALEKELCQIWAELLGLEKIGITDNFFQVGGHSLLGMRLVTRIRQTFQIPLPLVALFNAPTIAELSLVIEDLILTEIEELDEA